MLTIWLKKSLFAGSMGTAIALTMGTAWPKAGYANPLQLAQVASQTASLQPQTISVVGEGKASVTATSAAIVFTYVSNSYPEYSETGELVTPIKIPQPSDIQNIVDAVKAEGIAYDIQVSQKYYDYQYLQMTVKLKNPTRDRVDKIRSIAAKTAIEDGKFSANPASVIYATDSCGGIESTARNRAVADAKERAVLLAEAADLKLGTLSAIGEGPNFSYYGAANLTCPTDLDKILNEGDGSLVGFENYNSASSEITVIFNVYATYKVEE